MNTALIDIKEELVKMPEVKCPVCRSLNCHTFVELKGIPVHCNLLWKTREAALNAPVDNINLAFCGNCTHVFNSDFNPELMQYDECYENSLHFSAKFQEYANWLADQLIERHGLRNKTIIEIGCGKGDFLKLLCGKGDNHGIGFDNSYEEEEEINGGKTGIKFIKDFYSEKYSHYKADFILCRHVLEHIYNPGNFLNIIRQTINDEYDTKVFFEVPNLLWTLRDLSIWDIIYEHYSYFSSISLTQLFLRCGFRIHAIYETYQNQFICIEASPDKDLARNVPFEIVTSGEIKRYADTFSSRLDDKIDEWKRKLEKISQRGQKVVLWGAGSKGVTFLNIMNISSFVEYIVDINPRKHGMFITGSGQEIVGPSFLMEYNPDIIIVMNPVYLDEVKTEVRNMGIRARVVPV